MRRLLLIFILLCVGNAKAQTTFKKIQQDFLNPASDTRPGCYWYWINDNISKTGITKDLEAMQRVGIGRAYIGHIFDRRVESDTKAGVVKFKSAEWWELLQWAVKEAERCKVDIGFFNAPGWSQSGGPWITTAQSMRYLGNSELAVIGGKQIDAMLPIPEIATYPNTRAARVRTGPNYSAKDFQDVRVIAYKQPDVENQNHLIENFSGTVQQLERLFDPSDTTFSLFTANKTEVISFKTAKSGAVQNIVLKSLDHSFVFTCKVESSSDGLTYQTLKNYTEERGHQGAKRTNEIVIPIKETHDIYFRLAIEFKAPGNGIKQVRVGQISVSGKALLAGYVRKQLGETSPDTKIPWNAYLWEAQDKVAINTVIKLPEVIDITEKMDTTGRLKWQAPAGNWNVLRFGMIPTGTQCHPCGPESLGLEVDKMNRQHVTALFEGMVGEFLSRTPAKDRQALKYIIADSYETGPQNWTDDFIAKFTGHYGYSPIKYLPVLTGRVVESVEQSDRFLWDLRRLVVESVANDYLGGLSDICAKNNLSLLAENYGHWGYISEFLLYGSKAEEVAGEIWENTDPITNVELRAAASSAHIYGKNAVYAETFTSNRNFRQSPGSLKKWADWTYGAGINHMILHVYIHQPDERKPGIIQWFGTAFNRHNTWFEQSKPFIDYMRRSAVLLKSGNPVADVAYYIGENSPSMTGVIDPALPTGYDFDHINSDVLINRAHVKNGRITIENGPSYALLVLPPFKEMRPEVAEAIKKLVKAGAVVLGSRPDHSPSLQGYPTSDQRLKTIVNELWGTTHTPHQYGLGWVYTNVGIEEVLQKLKVQKDIELLKPSTLKYGVAGGNRIGVNETGGLIFKHRTADDHEVYFLSNTANEAANITVSFRQSRLRPFLFNAVNGEIHAISYTKIGDRTLVPLCLTPSESAFIVFAEADGNIASASQTDNLSGKAIDLSTDWTVKFQGQGAPAESKFEKLQDWTTANDAAIKYYSGTAVYEKIITMNPLAGEKYNLELGEVGAIATVYLNQKLVGTVWTSPWKIDLTPFMLKGENKLSIQVTNDWNNRLVGDQLQGTSFGYVSQPFIYDKKMPLLRSGLIGPVLLRAVKDDQKK